MKLKRRSILFCICAMLGLCLMLLGCQSAEPASAISSENSTPAPAAVPPGNWEPTLEIEWLSPTGAIIVFHQDTQSSDYLVLSGNDYTLQHYSGSGWVDLPATQDHVNWVPDAFVVAAVPRDDIDWEWLYGALEPGYYRLGKSVALYRQEQVVERSTVYAEFILDAPEDPLPETAADTADISTAIPPDPYPYTYSPLSASTAYTYQEAMLNNVVILENGSAIENQAVWDTFVRAADAHQIATVRCIQLGDDYGFPDVYDVHYDGLMYTMQWFDGSTEKSLSFKNMLCFQGDPDAGTVRRYVLVMDRKTTWEDIQWGMASGNDLDAIAHLVVYQELRYVPSQPPIPENSSVSLILRGEPLFHATETQAAQLTTLFSEAKYMNQKPDCYYRGLDLVFTGADGSRVTLWLSYNGDHFLYNGSFYSYSTEKLLSVFHLTDWPDAVRQAHS